MQKKLIMLCITILLLIMTACAKSTSESTEVTNETLQAQPGQNTTEIPKALESTEANDITDIPEETEEEEANDIAEEFEVEDTTDASEEAQDNTLSEPAIASEPSSSFKTEWGYIGCVGNPGNVDWLKCYILDGYYDGDDFVANNMQYVWIKNNTYNPLERYSISLDGSLTIGKDYKLISETEKYSIYQDSESEYYTLVPGFNNMVIGGYMDDITMNAFLSTFTYEGDNSELDMFDNIDFSGYHFADQMNLSDNKFYAEMSEDRLPTLDFLQLGSYITINFNSDKKSRIKNDLNMDSSAKTVNKGDTYPNFKMYSTKSCIWFIGVDNVPTLGFIGYKPQDAYDTLKELIVADE